MAHTVDGVQGVHHQGEPLPAVALPGAAGQIRGPMILGLALIESLVLLSFVIAFFLQGYAAVK